MKYLFFSIIALFFIIISKKITTQNSPSILAIYNLNDKVESHKMKIKIGSKTFTATLFDNETTKVFKTMLPLTLRMSELNGNEKYVRFSKNLPTNTESIGTIHEGDLMLWGANTLVLFYKTFKTQYPYTKLGHIDNPSGLAAAVGSGDATISFQLE